MKRVVFTFLICMTFLTLIGCLMLTLFWDPSKQTIPLQNPVSNSVQDNAKAYFELPRVNSDSHLIMPYFDEFNAREDRVRVLISIRISDIEAIGWDTQCDKLVSITETFQEYLELLAEEKDN